MFPTLTDLFIRLITLAIAFTVHELAHAVVAVSLGDETPRRAGRLTLNPVAHLDPAGTLFFLVSGFGWAKPVPVNPLALRRRDGMLWVSLAGPLSNLGLALLGSALYRLPLGSTVAHRVVSEFVWLNLILLFFNLLPLPPLDGATVLAELAPRFWHEYLAPLQPYAPALFLVIVFVLPMFGLDVLRWVVGWPAGVMARLLL